MKKKNQKTPPQNPNQTPPKTPEAFLVEFVCKQVSGPSCWDLDKMFDDI